MSKTSETISKTLDEAQAQPDAAPVPPAGGEVEVLPASRTNFDYQALGDDGYIAAKAWNECLKACNPIVTRLQAELDTAENACSIVVEECRKLVEDCAALKAEVEDRTAKIRMNLTQLGISLRRNEQLQSELTKAREALEGMVEYFPEGHSDGECFSVERAKAVLAHQFAAGADCDHARKHHEHGGTQLRCSDCGEACGPAARGIDSE